MYETILIRKKPKQTVLIYQWKEGGEERKESVLKGKGDEVGLLWLFEWSDRKNDYERRIRRMTGNGVFINEKQSSSLSLSSSSTTTISAIPITPTTLREEQYHIEKQSSTILSSIKSFSSTSSTNQSQLLSTTQSHSKPIVRRTIPVGYVIKMYSVRREVIVPWFVGVFVLTWFVIMYVMERESDNL